MNKVRYDGCSIDAEWAEEAKALWDMVCDVCGIDPYADDDEALFVATSTYEELRMDQFRVLQGPFDVETHKATFINYLELVIGPDGEVRYAHPSHTAVLEAIYGELFGRAPTFGDYEAWLRDSDVVYDYMEWLIHVTGAIGVWNRGVIGVPNDAQEAQLEMLRREGLLKDGPIHGRD